MIKKVLKYARGVSIFVMVLTAIIYTPILFFVLLSFLEKLDYQVSKPRGALIVNEVAKYRDSKCPRDYIEYDHCYYLNQINTEVYIEEGYDEYPLGNAIPRVSKVRGADPSTFKHIGRLALDKNNVYYKAKVVPDLSPAGVKMVGRYIFGTKKSNLEEVTFFVHPIWVNPFEMIENIDVASLRVFEAFSDKYEYYTIDKNNVYHLDEVVSTASNEFRQLEVEITDQTQNDTAQKTWPLRFPAYFRDDKLVYVLDRHEFDVLDMHAASTRLLGSPRTGRFTETMVYLKDKESVYFDVRSYESRTTKMKMANTERFKFVCSSYDLLRPNELSLIGMDDKYVFANDTVLKSVSPDNFDRAEWCKR